MYQLHILLALPHTPWLLLRFVEEVRENQLEEHEKDTSSYAGQQAAAKTRR